MKSSTRTTPRKTKKKWSKTECLLLLAPLLVVGGLALLNFAPQAKRSFQEWREYGNTRPYAVFYPKDQKGTGDLALYPIAFSPDGKYIAASEFGTSKFTVGNHGVGVWDVASRQQVSSWPVTGKRTFVNILKFVSPGVLDVGLWIWTGGSRNPQAVGERRDAQSGKFLSSQKVHLLSEVPPGASYYAYVFPPSQFSNPRLEKLGHTKLSIKLFTIKTLIEDLSLSQGGKCFVVQWMAQIYDAQGQKLRKPFALFKYFDRSSGVGVSGSSMEFYASSDGKTLIIHPRTTDFFNKGIKQETDEWIEAFDTATGRSLWKHFLTRHNKQNGLLRAIAFSPKSNVTAVLIDQYQGGVSQGGNVELHNTRTGTILRQFKVRPFTKNYEISLYTQFSPDGKLLAIPQDDRLELWDVSDVN